MGRRVSNQTKQKMYVYIILFQSVNTFQFPNTTALKYIHTFVTRTSMTAFDHNFKSQGKLLNYSPKGVNHSQNNSTAIFLNFGISPQFFCNHPKI